MTSTYNQMPTYVESGSKPKGDKKSKQKHRRAKRERVDEKVEHITSSADVCSGSDNEGTKTGNKVNAGMSRNRKQNSKNDTSPCK